MFQSARIKLTAWYVTIIMLISFLFTLGMYQLLMREVERFARMQRFRVERDFGAYTIIPQSQNYLEDLVEDARHRLILNLITINLFILISSAYASYFLAGKTLRPIKEMMDAQSRFVSDASHELRTPLTSLKSAIEVYLRGTKQTLSEANELIRSNLEDVEHMSLLTTRLLKLSNQTIPIAKLDNSKVNLTEVLDAAIKTISPVAVHKRIQLTAQNSDVTVWGDSGRLQELFTILLDNAVKYTEKGSVVVRTEKTDGQVKVLISDSGIGISPQDVPHIFDRFYRSDTARSNNHLAGYGLGLSIAKDIVRLHHGKIDVHSEPGAGSTFTVTLPIVFS